MDNVCQGIGQIVWTVKGVCPNSVLQGLMETRLRAAEPRLYANWDQNKLGDRSAHNLIARPSF